MRSIGRLGRGVADGLCRARHGGLDSRLTVLAGTTCPEFSAKRDTGAGEGKAGAVASPGLCGPGAWRDWLRRRKTLAGLVARGMRGRMPGVPAAWTG